MHKLTYFYLLIHPPGNSFYSGVVDVDSVNEWLDSNAHKEAKEKIKHSAEKASGNLMKASDWQVVVFNKI